MIKKSILFTTLAALMLTFGAAGAFACEGGSCGNHHGGGLEGKFFWKAHVIEENQQELGLSDDKIDSIKKLTTETRKNLIRQEAELEVIEIDLDEKLRANPVDVQAVNDLVDKKFETKKTMLKGLVDSFAKLKATLTPDQYEKFRALFKEGHGKHGK